MALNSSGPLSFGGSTVGQSINLELGVSATAQASINATDFRALAGVPSGQISVNVFYGKSSATFYFVHIPGNNFGGGGPGESNITKDSSDNFYVNVGLTGSRGTLIKFNSSFTYVTNVYWTNVFSYMYNPTAIGSQVLIPGSFSRQISFFDNSLANTINRNTTDYYGSVSDIYVLPDGSHTPCTALPLPSSQALLTALAQRTFPDVSNFVTTWLLLVGDPVMRYALPEESNPIPDP